MKLLLTLLALLLVFATTNIATSSKVEELPHYCDEELLKLTSCHEYIAAPPNEFSSSPSSECCNDFSSMFYTNGGCLCYLVNQPLMLGFPLNTTRIRSLSSVCPGPASSPKYRISVQSLCDGSANSPSPSPSSPASSPSTGQSPVEAPTSSPSRGPSPVEAPTSSPSTGQSPVQVLTSSPSSGSSPVHVPTSSPSPVEAPSNSPTSSPSSGSSPVHVPTSSPSPVEAPSNSPTSSPSPVEARSNSPSPGPSPVEATASSPQGYGTHSPATLPDEEPDISLPWITAPAITIPDASQGCQFLPVIGLYIVSMIMLHL